MFKVKKDGYFNFFEGEGRFYKGNLHTHSTRSDGRLSPEEVSKRYKDRGYDFIALTDHHIYTDMPELESDDFLVLPGAELALSKSMKNAYSDMDDHGLTYHFVVIKHDYKTQNFVPHDYKEEYDYDVPEGADTKDVARKIYRYYLDRGNFVVLAHPEWSRAYDCDCDGFDDIIGVEVYNTHCDKSRYCGYSEHQWDYCLRRGYPMWGLATDDCHYKGNEAFGGWVCVKSETLSRESIAKSLVEGRFYSSTGPDFNELYMKDGIVNIKCSPVKRIALITYNNRGTVLEALENQLFTQEKIELPKKGKTLYFRVVLEDEQGKQAWSNPVYIED